MAQLGDIRLGKELGKGSYAHKFIYARFHIGDTQLKSRVTQLEKRIILLEAELIAIKAENTLLKQVVRENGD